MTPTTEQDSSVATNRVATPIGADEVAKAFRDGPIGALVVAGVAVAILFVGWLAFYFFVFMPRGSIG